MTRNDVYEILEGYYGIEKTDRQSGCMIIWWPSVVVSNEAEDKITIWDLYARVLIDASGHTASHDGLKFKRTTYNKMQWYGDYCHSHISWSNDRNEDFTQWCHCCLGTGPLVRTLRTLHENPSQEIWELFAWELDKYVRVESEDGGPYHHMRDLYAKYNDQTKYSLQPNTYNHWSPTVCNFMKYTLTHNVLKFSFNRGKYVLGEDINEAVLALSNQFISWYNMSPDSKVKDELFRSGILVSCTYSSGKVLYEGDTSDEYSNRYHRVFESCIGTKMLTFKGQDILLKSTSIKSVPVKVTVLGKDLVSWIIYTILSYINEYYRRTSAA